MDASCHTPAQSSWAESRDEHVQRRDPLSKCRAFRCTPCGMSNMSKETYVTHKETNTHHKETYTKVNRASYILFFWIHISKKYKGSLWIHIYWIHICIQIFLLNTNMCWFSFEYIYSYWKETLVVYIGFFSKRTLLVVFIGLFCMYVSFVCRSLGNTYSLCGMYVYIGLFSIRTLFVVFVGLFCI